MTDQSTLREIVNGQPTMTVGYDAALGSTSFSAGFPFFFCYFVSPGTSISRSEALKASVKDPYVSKGCGAVSNSSCPGRSVEIPSVPEFGATESGLVSLEMDESEELPRRGWTWFGCGWRLIAELYVRF